MQVRSALAGAFLADLMNLPNLEPDAKGSTALATKASPRERGAVPVGRGRPPPLGGAAPHPLAAGRLGGARRARAPSNASAPPAGSRSPALSTPSTSVPSRACSKTGQASDSRPGEEHSDALPSMVAAAAVVLRSGVRARSESPLAATGAGRQCSRSDSVPSLTTPVGGAARGAVPLTREILLGATGLQRCHKESTEAFLARITHLKLQGHRLGPQLGDILQQLPGLTVLYAYDNLLSSLAGLDHLRRLQLLYLQSNRLCTMRGIEACTNLRVLHLSGNRLARIEGLNGCSRLEELHVSNQRPFLAPAGGIDGGLLLGGGDALEFCPDSVAAIAPSLTSLSAAGNRLRDVSSLAPLLMLRTLDLSNNQLQQVTDVRPLICGPFLTHVELHGNPLALNERKHRSLVVLSAGSVEEIDGKAVLPHEKDFVRRLEVQKMKLQAQRQAHLARHGPGGSPIRMPLATTMKSGGRSGSCPPVLQDLLGF